MVLRAKIGRYPRDARVLLHLVQLDIEFRDVNSGGSLQPVNHSHSLAALRAALLSSRSLSAALRATLSLTVERSFFGRASRGPLSNLGT